MSAPIQPSLRLRLCAREGCPNRYDTLYWTHPWPKAYCSAECHRDVKRAEAPAPKPRMRIVTRVTEAPRRPISAGSREQVAKRNAGASIVSGQTRGLHAAHICPRALGGCDDPDCTVPLTQAEHRAFDEPDPRTGKRLDLLPYLVAHGCHAELSHALWHYRLDLVALLERVTGEKWEPQSSKRRP
jgi:hypothetical protein